MNRYREVHFHLVGTPDPAEVAALTPSTERVVDVSAVDHDLERQHTRIIIEVPQSEGPEHAIGIAAEYLAKVLPSAAVLPWDEEGVKVAVFDPKP